MTASFCASFTKLIHDQKHHFFIFPIFLIFSCQPQKHGNNASIYFSAHPDDWQLFMGENAYADILDRETKTIFILTTAGDAAMGMASSENTTMPYYKARERGYINALLWTQLPPDFHTQTGRGIHDLQTYQLEKTEFLGHEVKKFEQENFTAYLLYLPDGFPEGQFQWSLQKLFRGELTDMPTIDSTTIYKDWLDLELTVKAILDEELTKENNVVVNLADRDVTINPADHSDHMHTSMLGELASAHLNPTKRYYREYMMAELDTNLNEDQQRIKRYLFTPNALSKEQAGYDTPWNDHHLAWVVRSYWREVMP